MRTLGLLLVLAGALLLGYEAFAWPAAPAEVRPGADAGGDPENLFGGIAVTAGLILVAVGGRPGNRGAVSGGGGRQALPV